MLAPGRPERVLKVARLYGESFEDLRGSFGLDPAIPLDAALVIQP